MHIRCTFNAQCGTGLCCLTHLEDILDSMFHYLGLQAMDWDTSVSTHTVPCCSPLIGQIRKYQFMNNIHHVIPTISCIWNLMQLYVWFIEIIFPWKNFHDNKHSYFLKQYYITGIMLPLLIASVVIWTCIQTVWARYLKNWFQNFGKLHMRKMVTLECDLLCCWYVHKSLSYNLWPCNICECAHARVCVCVRANKVVCVYICIYGLWFIHLVGILGSIWNYLGQQAVDWHTLVVIHSVP